MSFNFDLNDSFASYTPPTPPDGCTQCGICFSTCPTYTKSGDAQQSPMGRIRMMRALGNDSSDDLAMEKLESCLGCYSCEIVCPSRVNFGKLLDESMAQVRELKPVPRITRMMLWLARRFSFLKPIIQVTYLAQTLGLRTLLSKLGLLKFMGLQRADALLGRVNYPTELRNSIKRPRYDQRVALFTGCFSSVMEQEIQQVAIDLLNALGLEVVIPEGQGCCGALHRHSGELKAAGKLARKNIKAFSADKADAIITTSSGCGASLKKYGEWLEGEELTMPVMDVSHYLANAFNHRKVVFDHLPLKVALHTPCTLRQNEGQEEAVLELLQNIPGLEVIPLSGEPRCCGAGGSQMLSQPEMADALRNDIIEEVSAMGANVLISSNLGCAMHLRNGLVQAGIDIPLQHPVQLIAKAMAVEFVNVRN